MLQLRSREGRGAPENEFPILRTRPSKAGLFPAEAGARRPALEYHGTACLPGSLRTRRYLTALGIPMNWTPQPLPYGRGSVTGVVCLQVVTVSTLTEPRP